MAKERKEVEIDDQLDVASLYPSLEAWKEDFSELIKDRTEKGCWPHLGSYQGKIGEDS